MKQHFKSTILLLFTLPGMSIMAQQSNNVASNKAIIQGNSYEYSIGEMTMITTCKAGNLIVTQGFIQPHRVSTNSSTTTSTNEMDELSKNISVYPNPTQNTLYVETHQSSESKLSYELFDTKGAIVLIGTWQQNHGDNKCNLNVEALTSGSYFLALSSENKEKQKDLITFRIQKVN